MSAQAVTSGNPRRVPRGARWLPGALACAVAFGLALAADAPRVGADAAKLAGAPAGLRPEDFARGMPIMLAVGADSPAWRVSLPLEVYRALVRADRGDLRVFNGRGEVVPYQWRRPQAPSVVGTAAVALPLFALRGDAAQALRDVRVRIESGGASVSVATPAVAAGASPPIAAYIVDGRSVKSPLDAFELRWVATEAQFAGQLEIEASEDLGRWRRVASGSIANLTAGAARLVENRIELPPTASRFWRLSWSGAAAPFVLEGVSARPAGERPEIARANTAATGVPAPGRPGEYDFDLGAALPVERINVALPETNTVVQGALATRALPAQSWSTLVPDLALYRLTSDGRELRNAAREIDPTPRRYWQLRLPSAGAGLGTAPPVLEAAWPADEVWFVARGAGPFLLAYGSATAQPADTPLDSMLAAVRRGDDGLRIAVAAAALGPERVLGGESRRRAPAPPFPWRSAILWAVLAGGVLALGAMALRLMRETREPDPQ